MNSFLSTINTTKSIPGLLGLGCLVCLLLCGSTAVAQQSLQEILQLYNTRSVPYISVEELRMQQLSDSLVILDARETNEFSVSHLPGALHIGFTNFSIDAVARAIPNKDTPISVYCSLGIRSEEISEKLIKAGYTRVHNVYGGIFAWKNKGYPVLNQNGRETDSIHVFSNHWGQWLTNGIKTTK